MTEDHHILDLIPAFALECLEEEEAVAVTRHLATCEICRADLRAYREIASQLAFSVSQVEPPAALKAGLLARVQAVQLETDRAPRRSGWQRFFAALPRLSPVWAVASLALILILGASNVLLWQQVRELRARQAPLPVVALNSTAAAPGATGMLVISDDGLHGTLVVDNLPDLGEAQQYQLWLIENGQRASGGVFSVSPDGYGSVWVHSPKPLASFSTFGITIEPEGGSPGPTGEKVLGSDL
jgi:anti-sigma-K factor RskA